MDQRIGELVAVYMNSRLPKDAKPWDWRRVFPSADDAAPGGPAPKSVRDAPRPRRPKKAEAPAPAPPPVLKIAR